MPETITRPIAWQPTPTQATFLRTPAFEALFGGSCGGGKSDSLLAGALRYVDNPRYSALLLRRTHPELERSLIERSRALFPAVEPRAVYNEQKRHWRFPSGARIQFGHCETEADVGQYQSAEFQNISFDELTTFAERQYRFLVSRLRSSAGIPCVLRAGTNPGGPGHAWVLTRWAPWLDANHPRPAASGEIRFFDGDGQEVDPGTPGALSRTFIRSRLADNPHIDQVDPTYRTRLASLDHLTRGRLLDGDWSLREKGPLFDRAWFDTVDPAAVPRDLNVCRWWDLAATEAGPGKDPDYSVGAKLGVKAGLVYVLDLARVRKRPKDVEDLVRATAKADGPNVPIWMEQEPGSGGVITIDHYQREVLLGFTFRGERSTGDKVSYAQPLSAAAERRGVKLVRGSWNLTLLDELESFPTGRHDDAVDAVAKAFVKLAHCCSDGQVFSSGPSERAHLGGGAVPGGAREFWTPRR